MKRRKVSRIMSLFLALTMTSLLAAGCGQKSSPNGSADAPANADSTSTDPSASTGTTPAYKDTLTIAHWEEPTFVENVKTGPL